MTDLEEVHAAVCQNPHDDGPRLAWADLIDRLHGEDADRRDRARYVRVMIREASRINHRHPDVEWLRWISQHSLPRWQMREVTTLFNSEREALTRAATSSSAAYKKLREYDSKGRSPRGYKATWARGFVGSLHMDVSDYCKLAPLLHARLPLERLVLDVLDDADGLELLGGHVFDNADKLLLVRLDGYGQVVRDAYEVIAAVCPAWAEDHLKIGP